MRDSRPISLVLLLIYPIYSILDGWTITLLPQDAAFVLVHDLLAKLLLPTFALIAASETGVFSLRDITNCRPNGQGIAAAYLTVGHVGQDIVLGIDGGADSLTLANWANGGGALIETVAFADGASKTSRCRRWRDCSNAEWRMAA